MTAMTTTRPRGRLLRTTEKRDALLKIAMPTGKTDGNYFVDLRFVEEMKKSGFIAKLHGNH